MKQMVFKNLKWEQAQRPLHWQGIIASIFLIASMILPQTSHAQDSLQTGQQIAQYDVYAGGIHALQSNLSINLTKDNLYGITLTAKTYGLLGKMAPWEGKFESHGWKEKTFKPKLHQSTTIWRKEKETKKYSYNKNGSFKSYSIQEGENKESSKEVDDKLTQNTSDGLTATLNTMNIIAQKNKCEGTTDVFDGKRRFQLIFKEKQQVDLAASRWNLYSGPAIECSAEVQPIAGAWHKKPRGWISIQEQGRKRGTMPTVWFAKMSEGEPAIPVKVRVKTSYGTLFMHMTKYKASGKTLALKE